MISICSICKRCENEIEFTALSTVRRTGRTFCHPDDTAVRIHEEPVTECHAFLPKFATLDRWFA